MRKKKKHRLHKKFKESWDEYSSFSTHEFIVRLFHTMAADTPISIYSKVHIIENTYPGGVSEDFTSVGYQLSIDSRCNSMDI